MRIVDLVGNVQRISWFRWTSFDFLWILIWIYAYERNFVFQLAFLYIRHVTVWKQNADGYCNTWDTNWMQLDKKRLFGDKRFEFHFSKWTSWPKWYKQNLSFKPFWVQWYRYEFVMKGLQQFNSNKDTKKSYCYNE